MPSISKRETVNGILDLVNEATTVVVGSIDENGYPNSKQMFKMKNDGLRAFWFSTNTSSMRVEQFKKNAKASLYFVGKNNGLMLVGRMKICTDRMIRQELWDDETSTQYYPLGINDPDYCVLQFTAQTGNYYQNLAKYTFDVHDLDGLRSQSTVIQRWSLVDDLRRLDLGDSEATVSEWRNVKALRLHKKGAAVFVNDDFRFESFRLQATVALPAPGFIGLVFGARDSDNYELIYLSPGDNNGVGQIQYDPVMNGSTTWQIYNGLGYLSYASYKVGEWVKFTIDVQGNSAQIYIGDDFSIPRLIVSDCQHGAVAGKIGVWGYDLGYIRDLSIEEIPSSPTTIDNRNKDEFVNEWLVSEPYFSHSRPDELSWSQASTEENGTLNINRLYASAKDKSVQVKSTVTVSEETKSLLSFGYSDALRLWINEEEVHQGIWMWNPPDHDGRIRPDHITLPVTWRPGVNMIRAEITSKETIFGWGMCLRTGL